MPAYFRFARFAFVAITAIVFAPAVLRAQSPHAAVNDLLAADRAFSAAGAGKDLVASLAAMFADDVIMPVPGRFARGKADAVATLTANAANAMAKGEWAPVRGGISADGLHGFTFGFMNVKRADGTTGAAKYLAYWVKGASGWRVAAYKRIARADGAVSTDLMEPSIPARMVPATTNAKLINDHRASLIAAESEFSALAQRIGLGPAFKETGSADAMNLGGAANAGFVVGNAQIAALVGTGQPATRSSVSWSADTAIVASSGDLGVTIGFIRPNGTPPAGAPSGGFPFFTIWRRASPGALWKYIAE